VLNNLAITWTAMRFRTTLRIDTKFGLVLGVGLMITSLLDYGIGA
jgi:hypothetical protein